MSILSPDWTCEHLIRAKPAEPMAPAAKQIGAEEARERDRDLILPLAKAMTQSEIAKKTGLSRNRVFVLCRYYGITCNKMPNYRRKEGGRL